MDKSLWIDGGGRKPETDDDVRVYNHDEPEEERIVLDLRGAIKNAFDRGRESVFNGPGYSADLRRSKVEGYKEGYAAGYAEGLEAGRNECETGSTAETPFVEADAIHIGDEIRSLVHAREGGRC